MTAAAIRPDGSDPLGRRELDDLAEERPSPCVSLYLPTHRAGAEIEQDPIRLRNLLASVERELASLGWRHRAVDELLAPARQLSGDRDFWRYQADGLAVFIAPSFFRSFRCALSFDELATVSTQFQLRPLLPLISGDETFWLLALSQNTIRLFRGSRHTIAEVDTGQAPANMAEALAHKDLEQQLQVRTSGPTSTGQFHGHSGGDEDHKADIEDYFRAIDRGLASVLDSRAPLVLAGVSYYGPIYRNVSTYPHIVDDLLAGSPDDLSASELHARAWLLLEPEFAARRQDVHDRYAQSRAVDRTAEGLGAVRSAASEGRVELLLVPRRGHRWASATDGDEPASHETREPGDFDLINDTVLNVLRTGGDAVDLADDEMPGDTVAAAILRYSSPTRPSPDTHTV